VSDTDTQIVFAQFQQPGLKDDTYTITAKISLAAAGAPTFLPVTTVLKVGTDAETIPADSVVSVYPPDGESGKFTGHLPHVVIGHPSLPWQKDVPGGSDATPWLALLLITDEELRGPDVTVAKAPPMLTLSAAFFQSIAPTLDELVYLAHVRRVDTKNKVDSTELETTYALVVGNRLPPEGAGATAFLVPLHNHAGQLPTKATSGAAATGEVQLPVLYSWHFFNEAETRTFAQIVSGVDHDPPPGKATLALPGGASSNPLAMGYVPLPHALRVGGQTVSWYRGPCLPYANNRQLPRVPIRWADEITFYDPDSGMMDVSCSSAWTLGRLLALNSGSFAAAVYNWKRATARVTIDKTIYQLDTGQPAPPGPASKSLRAQAERNLAALLPAALAQLRGHPPVPAAAKIQARTAQAPAAMSRRQRAAYLHDVMTDHNKIAAVHGLALQGRDRTSGGAPDSDDSDVDPNLARIFAWLGDLVLLKGMPLSYLIPDARMLPPESIRFFQIDQSWLTAVIDGAMSLGRVTEADASHDAAMHAMVLHGATRMAAAARARRRGVPLADAADPALPSRPCCGFFLRSSAVTNWPGLQVEGAGPDGDAKILRMDATGTLLICLFDRPVSQVKLHPPSEGIHFGFVEDLHLNLFKKRRRLSADAEGPIGSEIDADELTTVPFRDAGTRILDIGRLATLFANSFSMTMKAFTSAEFALQMIAGVDQVTLELGS
jgi:hypothetical protein